MLTSSSLDQHVKQHYAPIDLIAIILDALSSAGKDVDNLKPEDLAPIDEFHIRGREATLELARAAGITSATRVLDVGCGLGGASRCIAHQFSCRVTGIDLTDEYCRVATMLAERCGLSALVDYRQGDALQLPYSNARFDILWSQHAAMNIPDKAKLYGEMFRVLNPGGTLAIYDVLAGPTTPVHFPVPWARTPEISFLATPDELHYFLERTGFRIISWEDTTSAALEWFDKLAARFQKRGPPPLGFHLFLGADFQIMARNQVRNLAEGRIILAQVVARKGR
ncbi:MAG TPA: methyltransferase domain-containing protein [Anaerolineales bacterium]|nr:methyltransferase domain-containing protein [Anaerolineales bacterium]